MVNVLSPLKLAFIKRKFINRNYVDSYTHKKKLVLNIKFNNIDRLCFGEKKRMLLLPERTYSLQGKQTEANFSVDQSMT